MDSRLGRLLAPVLLASLSLGCAPESEEPGQPAASPDRYARAPELEAPDERWWRDVVFYEIFVRSFADASEGPLSDDGVGDLVGLIERLDYLNDGDPETTDDLGVGGLWLMPVAESPSYHGYDVTDYYRIEPDYGTNDDFRRLISEAHRRGVRVVIDLVLNHTSSDHPWFREAMRRDSPRRDWYIWSYERRDYLGPWGQPVWHQLPWWRRGWRHFNYHAYYGIFWSGMPDLNYRNSAVTGAMHEMARFWLQEMGADGFRLDAVRHLIEDGQVQQGTAETHDWLRGFHAFCKESAPSAMLLGEVWDDTEAVAAYGPDELDLAFQFELAGATLLAIRDADRGPLDRVYQKMRRLQPEGRFASFLTNHDQPRVLSQLYDVVGRARAAASILLTGPGAPFVYYGEEIGMRGFKPDELIRRPMQWSAERHAGFSADRPWQQLDPDWPRTNVAAQDEDPASLLSLYRRLIHLRNRRSALQRGSFEPLLSTDARVWALSRRAGSERLVVLVNLAREVVEEYAIEAPGVSWGVVAGAREILQGVEVDERAVDVWSPIGRLDPLTAYVVELPATADLDIQSATPARADSVRSTSRTGMGER